MFQFWSSGMRFNSMNVKERDTKVWGICKMNGFGYIVCYQNYTLTLAHPIHFIWMSFQQPQSVCLFWFEMKIVLLTRTRSYTNKMHTHLHTHRGREGERETGSPPKTIFNEDESVNHVHLWHYKRWFCPKIIMKWFHSVIQSSGFDSTFQWSLGNEPTNNSSYREMDEAREEKNSSSKATYEINDVDDSNMHIFTLDGSFRLLLWLWHFAWFPCHKCVCSLWAFASELNEFCGLCTKQRLPNDMNVRKY